MQVGRINRTDNSVGRMNTRRVDAAAAGNWWDANGMLTSCTAAYLAKGAASKAASKVNLVTPGTIDLTETGTVGWTSAGWYPVVGAYMNTAADITDFANFTIAIYFKCSLSKQPYIFYNNSSNNLWDYGYNLIFYYYGSTTYRNVGGGDGVDVRFIITPTTVFRNGNKVLTGLTPGATARDAITRICQGYDSGATAIVYAASFYNAGLSDEQAVALDTELAAL